MFANERFDLFITKSHYLVESRSHTNDVIYRFRCGPTRSRLSDVTHGHRSSGKKITNIFLIIRDSAISTFLTRWKTINHEPQHTNSICYFFALVWWQSCGGCFCCYDNGHSQSRFMWSEMDWLLFFVRVFLVTNTVWDVRKSVESIGKHYHFHAMEPQNSIWGFRNGDSESSQAFEKRMTTDNEFTATYDSELVPP